MPSTEAADYEQHNHRLWYCKSDMRYYLFLRVRIGKKTPYHTVEGFPNTALADEFIRGMEVFIEAFGADPGECVTYLSPKDYMDAPMEKDNKKKAKK